MLPKTAFSKLNAYTHLGSSLRWISTYFVPLLSSVFRRCTSANFHIALCCLLRVAAYWKFSYSNTAITRPALSSQAWWSQRSWLNMSLNQPCVGLMKRGTSAFPTAPCLGLRLHTRLLDVLWWPNPAVNIPGELETKQAYPRRFSSFAIKTPLLLTFNIFTKLVNWFFLWFSFLWSVGCLAHHVTQKSSHSALVL